MTIMDGDDMQRLWSLIEDLTNQLQANRQLCESLQQQADQLRGQAIHSGTGFALRRFNTDLSKEKFESELEALNVHLVKENLGLSHENKQQAVLLREYENTLETVMAKFRSFSHSTQQHTLQLTQHYESLLAQTTHNAAQQTLAAETTFSGTLTHLGGLVRRAMQSLDGEISDDDSDAENENPDDPQPRKAQRGWVQDPKWYGSGGYTGKTTDPVALRADEALEHLTEEERLRMENDTLRELLGLKDKSDALLSATPAIDTHTLPQAPKPLSPAERRASLTVDEAAIAAEASGQPPINALQVSSTLRPGEKATSPEATIPAASRASPKLAPTLERKDQIIEEAILADEEQDTGRGRRVGEASPVVDSDPAVFETVSLPSNSSTWMLADASADDAESAPSSIEELRAVAAQARATEAASESLQEVDSGVEAGADADAITPIDEADTLDSSPAAAGDGPNLVAEAAPPALVSTGIDDADALASNTTVTSASGTHVGEATPAHTATDATSSSDSIGSSTGSEAFSLPTSSVGSAEPVASATSPDASQAAAVPEQASTGSAESAENIIPAEPSVVLTSTEASANSISAEPTQEDERSARSAAAAEDTASIQGTGESLTSAEQVTESVEIGGPKVEGGDAEVRSEAAKDVAKPKDQPGQTKKADGSASPSKKGRRGKGNRHHNKSNSSASRGSS